MAYFNYNGKILKAETTIVGPDNHGLRYGDGLFETIKLVAGNIVHEDDHFARLWSGLKALQFEVPKQFTPDRLREEILQLAEKNGHSKAARVRVNIFRGNGGLYDVEKHAPLYCIQSWPLTQSTDLNSNGLVIGIYDKARKNYDVLSGIKHNSFLIYVLAAIEAKQQQWNDALILNNNDRICESTIANVFVIKDEKIVTPPLTEACIAGIFRRQLIRQLKEQGFDVLETPITIEDIEAADEVFLTNSISNIRWVQRLGNSTYSNTMTRQIFTTVVPTIL